MIELTFMKELMLIRQVEQKSAIFITIGFFKKRFKFQANICQGSHDLLTMSLKLSDIAILNIKGADYCSIINRSGKSKDINVI